MRSFIIGLYQGYWIAFAALARLRELLVLSYPEERGCCHGIVAFFTGAVLSLLALGAAIGAVAVAL